MKLPLLATCALFVEALGACPLTATASISRHTFFSDEPIEVDIIIVSSNSKTAASVWSEPTSPNGHISFIPGDQGQVSAVKTAKSHWR
jgi:hypothetical protein